MRLEYESILAEIKYLIELYNLIISEDEKDLLPEIKQKYNSCSEKIKNFECFIFFKGKFDNLNLYMDIQSGSGGVESQDWASILLRMYIKFCERHKFSVKILESVTGELGGIKNATLKISGNYAYGWLKFEKGIHRLVRKSPFNSNNKRHTSFCSIYIYPEIEENYFIEINNSDLKITTYKSSGAGGQHVNKTESAVRITHIPTSITVQCQSNRSQHKNKEDAIKQIKSKIQIIMLEKKAEKRKKEDKLKLEIAWGNQIRSYVLDESRIKDIRSGLELYNVKNILNGYIDEFIKANLTIIKKSG